jgi:hypothetical protein
MLRIAGASPRRPKGSLTHLNLGAIVARPEPRPARGELAMKCPPMPAPVSMKPPNAIPERSADLQIVLRVIARTAAQVCETSEALIPWPGSQMGTGLARSIRVRADWPGRPTRRVRVDPRSFPTEQQHEVVGLAYHPQTELAAARTHWALRLLAETASTWDSVINRKPISWRF